MTKRAAKRKATLPRKMSTKDLCMSLVGIAALHIEDKASQMKVYEAIRRLQIMEKAAIEAGLLPASGLADGEDARETKP